MEIIVFCPTGNQALVDVGLLMRHLPIRVGWAKIGPMSSIQTTPSHAAGANGIPDALVVAIDLGGTNIRTALCDTHGQILKRLKQPTRPEEGRDRVIQRMIDSVREVVPTESQIRAVAVASPGPLNPRTGIVMVAPNLFWHNVPLQQIMQDALNIPVRLGNDANLAALGEQRYGAGKGYADMAYVTVSTGIGCGVILNNQLVVGARGLATELGHHCINFTGAPIASGVPGGFEGYCAGPGIAKRAQARLAEGGPSILSEMVGGAISKVGAKEVGQAAKLGDPLALALVQETGYILGMGFVNLLHLFDVEAIVVGGSVSLMGNVLFDPVRETIQKFAMPPYRDRQLLMVALGDDGGLLGAAALASE